MTENLDTLMAAWPKSHPCPSIDKSNGIWKVEYAGEDGQASSLLHALSALSYKLTEKFPQEFEPFRLAIGSAKAALAETLETTTLMPFGFRAEKEGKVPVVYPPADFLLGGGLAIKKQSFNK